MANICSRRALALLSGFAALTAAAAPYLAAPDAAAATVPAYGTTWVVDHGNDSVTKYTATANGNSAPVARIAGSNTGLANPQSAVTDAVGDLFVTNLGGNSITEYAATANGNVAPTTTISGTATGLNAPYGLSLDRAGDLWVTNSNANTIEEFGAGQSGNITPYASIYGAKTGLDTPVGISARARQLWVVNDPEGGTPSVESFSVSGNGNVAPSLRIAGSKTGLSDPQSVAPDANGNPWVTNKGANSLLRFSFTGTTANRAPVASIAGNKTGLNQPAGVDVDAIGRLVVSNLGNASIEAFGASAKGNVAATRTVSGAATGISAPTDVTVLAAPPGAVRGLHAKRGNGRITLHWHAPSVTGGGILGYLTVKFRSKPTDFTFNGPVQTTKTTRTFHHLKNGHRYYFAVEAINARGASAGRTLVSAVPASTPGAVRELKAASRSDALLLTWKAPKSDGGSHIKGYRVTYATCRIGAKGCVAPTLKIGGKAHHFTLQDLAAGHRYRVRLTPRNALGYGKSVTVTGVAG